MLRSVLPPASKITITGGNLSVMLPLIGSRFAPAIDTSGKWLAIEELNESAESIDRMLAALKLNGLFDRAKGVILGDFRDGNADLSGVAHKILKYHLPANRRIPVVALENFGHIHPNAPLPIHRQVTLRCRRIARGKSRVTIDIPWSQWAD